MREHVPLVLVAILLILNLSFVYKLTISIDGEQLDYPATSFDAAWLLSFTSPHSVHTLVVYLGNVATKLPSNISCLVQHSEVPMGSALTVSGLILPTPSLSYGVVTLTYTQPDDTILNHTVPIMSDGSYGDQYAPRIVGEWQVTASWSGSTSLEGAISATRTFTVTVARIDIPLEYIAYGLICGITIFLLYLRRR